MASGGEKRPRGERGGKQARKQKEWWDRTAQGLRQPAVWAESRPSQMVHVLASVLHMNLSACVYRQSFWHNPQTAVSDCSLEGWAHRPCEFTTFANADSETAETSD